jgi:heme/copper-type cytochrome/quinol oxidase subunit 3
MAANFFSIYYMMTGLHGIHVVIGMGLITWMIIKAKKGGPQRLLHTGREHRVVLAPCGYHLDLPVPAAVPDRLKH